MIPADPRHLLHAPSLWLMATTVLTLTPHAGRLPAWLSALCALLIVWRALTLWLAHVNAHRALIALVAVAAAVALKADFGHFFGKDPGVAMLAVLLCLKQLEARSGRDLRAAVLLSFFLQLGLFFYDQTLPIAALALTGTFFALATLIALHDRDASTRHQMRTAGVLMLQALPFLLVLFMLFPRIPGPLWGLPADAWSAMTGLSDSMSPGTISQLGLSDAIAFRADFAGAPPPPAQRYWRGPVLTEFDGRVWRPRPFSVHSQPDYIPQGPGYTYRLTLEPHNQSWLLALEFPAAGASHNRYTSDHQLLAEQPVRTRTRFDLESFPGTLIGMHEDPAVLNAAVQLPPDYNPRTLALGRQLADGANSSGDVLARALEHLRRLDLTYTLRPPLLGTHSIDEFLFDTRRGFCEHFSAAFVFLMRAADVPARVVTGYQGGEINPIDGSMVIRQSDAHAWAEVWLAGRGWQRIDPTAVAAPSRIEAGLSAALPAGERLPLMRQPALSWLRDVRHQWEALSNAWNQSVLGYNAERQRQILSRLGFSHPDWRTLALLLGASAGTLMLLLLGWAVRRQRSTDPLDRAWSMFCDKLARKGIARLPWEGPMDYAERLAQAHPQRATIMREIADRYARLRYGPIDTHRAKAIRQLVKRIKAFHIK